MASRWEHRDAIRASWLNPSYWKFEDDLEIHSIFLLGNERDVWSKTVWISKREQERGDILQSDFAESHYNLSLKDHDFFTYIEENCPDVDFVFKGDDDILLVPENAMFHINRLKRQPVYALSHLLRIA